MIAATLSICWIAMASGQVPTIEAPDFAKPLQKDTLIATVRISNPKKRTLGSGVILAKTGATAYILTAAHVVDQADAVEVQVFSQASYPKPQHVYASVQVVARRTENNQDLALLRISGYAGESAGLQISPLVGAPKGKKITAFAAGCASNRIGPILRAESIDGPVLASRPGESKPATFWRSDQKSNLGESGGPLVNAQSQLLGICSGVQERHAYFCHLEDLRSFLRSAGLEWYLDAKK